MHFQLHLMILRHVSVNVRDADPVGEVYGRTGASQRNGPPPTPRTLSAWAFSSSLRSSETYSSLIRVLYVLTVDEHLTDEQIHRDHFLDAH